MAGKQPFHMNMEELNQGHSIAALSTEFFNRHIFPLRKEIMSLKYSDNVTLEEFGLGTWFFLKEKISDTVKEYTTTIVTLLEGDVSKEEDMDKAEIEYLYQTILNQHLINWFREKRKV